MFKKLKEDKVILSLVICILITLISAFLSAGFQDDFGRIDVQIINFNASTGDRLVGKLYRPVSATQNTPAPGILALHGFNNDKDVERPGAIELARAGFVVLSLDQAGHGDSGGSLLGEMFAPSKSYLDGYAYLQNLAFVDGETMGVFGHSMGAGNSREIALAFPDHDAIAVQSFAPSADDANYTKYNNLLHLWATWEEFGRGWDEGLEAWLERGYNQIATNYDVSIGEADTTYGSFSDGTARRHALMTTTHPGLTASIKSTSEIVAWMLQALKGMSESEAWAIADPAKQIWIGCEAFGLLALISTMISILPLAKLLMRLPYFKDIAQPMPERIITTDKKMWWIFATINAAIGGITYLFFSSFLPIGFAESFNILIIPPFYSIGIASGFMLWFIVNTIISLVLFAVWYYMTKKKDREGISLYDMGFAFKDTEGQKIPVKWNILGKTLLIAIILFMWMYLWVSTAHWLLDIEFRGIWSFMRPFTPERFQKFWFYIWPLLAFCLVNGGVFLFGQIRQKDKDSEAKTYIIWWFKVCYAMLMGLVVVILIQYAPMWFGGSPLLNEIDVAPMMPIQLMSFIPFAGLLFLLSIYFYRNTGKVWLGAFMFTSIAIWFQMTGLVTYF
jgi:pimeloyl-ACP methyl ester carboxylesterase